MKKVPISTILEEDETMSQEETEQATVVRTIEMNSKVVDLYNRIEASEKLTCEVSDRKMPKPLAYAAYIMSKQHPEMRMNSIINTLLAKNAQMLTAKGVKYVEKGRVGYCNYYGINFMPSGAGKDLMSDELDNFVYYPFRSWFKCTVQELREKFRFELEKEAKREFPEEDKQKQRKKYVDEKMREFGNIFLEVSDGTREGLFRDAKVIKRIGFGCIMIKIAELGLYLNNMTTEQKLFFNLLFEAYSGIIRAKSIKGEYREQDIEDLPVNILFYSDPTFFKADLAKSFNLLMETGLIRRCILTFMAELEPHKKEPDGRKAYKAEEKYYSDLKAIGLQLHEIFEEIENNAQYELTEETYVKAFYPYKLKLSSMAEKEENPLIKREIRSRELKALKISCQYASLNHPKVHFINPEDMEMAIDTVERLSVDFIKFLNYRPVFEDRYDRIFRFFLENIGKEFKKNDLTTTHFKQFGISRNKFKKSFDDDMQSVAEIAQYKGYQLLSKPINNNSGRAYWLTTAKSEDLSDDIQQLENLI